MNRCSYIILGFLLFVLMNLPRGQTDRMRCLAAGFFSPIWKSVVMNTGDTRLCQEESPLRGGCVQSDTFSEWLDEQAYLQRQAEELAFLMERSAKETKRADLARRVDRQKKLLELRYLAMPAQVVFRDPFSWNSSLWISLGEKDNLALGRTLIAQNSPVLVKGALVGVVEYVGKDQSRVRLITDAGLIVAVRTVRGGIQNCQAALHTKDLLEHVLLRKDLFVSLEEQQQFAEVLKSMHKRVTADGPEEWLAKGELFGCSEPLWRSHGALLKGRGFNCHYADNEGPARDLATGSPFGLSISSICPLVKTGDLLVTSGLDGVFPPGLPVGFVSAVSALKEGACFYELEARPIAGGLHDLSRVFVLPPLGLEEF